ncbi:alanine racemase [Prescottella defluvii]|nr:alanine racemase [Prescottella defluvii]
MALTPRTRPQLCHDLELAAYSCMQLENIATAARQTKRRATVHLKAETGMWRGGASDEWTSLVARARELETTGDIDVVGIWSHLARADEPDDPSTDAQRDAFEHAVDIARSRGLRPRLRHLANSAATLTRDDLHYEMVRCGLAVYGVNPLVNRSSPVPLQPALTVRTTVVHVKSAPAGVGVSYGHTYRTGTDTRLALLPLGYADGLPVLPAPHPAPFGHRGIALQLAGRICMDQTVADIGTHSIAVGDTVAILGPGDDGEWTAEDWAHGSGRSAYDILTGLGRRRMGLKYVEDS